MARARIVFMGTPDLAATCLARLIDSGTLDVVAVVSQPDRPRGRRLHIQPTPVKAMALASNLPVLQPDTARGPGFLDSLRELKPDLIAVAAYGQILPQTLLDIPPHGCLNVHTSLLPRYRGAAPIQWAILNGDRETGVTIMQIVPELDAGDIVTQASTPITADDTAQTLHDRLADLGADLLVQTIPDYLSGKLKPVPQNAGEVVYARKITKADGSVDWTRPAVAIWNQVRGLIPWPGAFTQVSIDARPARLKLWQTKLERESGSPGTILEADRNGIVVACGDGSLRILELQPEGKRRMTAREFLAGHPLVVGSRLTIS